MTEKEDSEETEEIIEIIEKKIQYGKSENFCFACGEKIDLRTKICPTCDTPQDKNNTILKE